MEIKVGYYLSDLTRTKRGRVCLVPGSHRRTPEELRDMNYRVPRDQYIELNVPGQYRPAVADPGLALCDA